MPIKVVHITQDMGMGGQERSIISIIDSLDSNKFEQYILCLSDGGIIADHLIKNGYKITILKIKNYNSLKNIFLVAKWIRDNKIDIVHTHAHPAGYLGRIAALISGRRPGIVHHVRTVQIDFNWKQHFKDSILGLFTDRILCVSHAVKNNILKHEWFNSKHTEVLYTGIKNAEIEKNVIECLKAELKIDSTAPIIGAVSSFSENKGHKYLLQALAIVIKDVPNTILVLVGDGPLRSYLEKIAEELKIKENIVFCGIQDDIFPFIALVDIFTQSSVYREGLGRSIIEAMILSKPVVASRLHGNVEIIEDGKSGFLVPPRDSNAFADAIIKLIRDKKLTEDMGRRGREIYQEKFTLERMARTLEELYANIFKK